MNPSAAGARGYLARPSDKDMTDTHWLAWAAGILDGEGSIMLNHRKRYARWEDWTLRVTVTNTDPRMLERMREMFGGSIQPLHKATQPHWKPSWAWVVTARKAEACLRLMLPWLVTKRDRAELAILSRQHIGRGKWHRRTGAEAESQRWLKARLSELNNQSPVGGAGQSTPPKVED